MIHALATRTLRRLEPEQAHRLTIAALKAGLGPLASRDDPVLATTVAGLSLPNPIGLAAGFDKGAEVPDAMLRAGFGFAEAGTVTPRPQPGNPQPRMFRLPEDGAVINRLGFNNPGLEVVAARLRARPRRGVVGANLGANKDSADRVGDYVAGLRRLWGLADYFTVNISSPNTPGLRALQGGDELAELLGRLAEARATLTGSAPLFLKVAPDLEEADAARIVEQVLAAGFAGVIVSNTTIARPADLRSASRGEAGGLSGAPLREPALRALRWFRAAAGERLALIGVGGIGSSADAYARIRAGASAVQLYTAMVYAGPGLVGRIKRDLTARLRADGFRSVAEAVGA